MHAVDTRTCIPSCSLHRYLLGCSDACHDTYCTNNTQWRLRGSMSAFDRTESVRVAGFLAGPCPSYLVWPSDLPPALAFGPARLLTVGAPASSTVQALVAPAAQQGTDFWYLEHWERLANSIGHLGWASWHALKVFQSPCTQGSSTLTTASICHIRITLDTPQANRCRCQTRTQPPRLDGHAAVLAPMLEKANIRQLSQCSTGRGVAV
jgi:hypothetical protein